MFVSQVHEYYERWLIDGLPCAPPAPVLIIDANNELEEVMKSYHEHMPVILGKEKMDKKETKSNGADQKEDSQQNDSTDGEKIEI